MIPRGMIEAWLEVTIRNRNGRIIRHTKRRSHSFVSMFFAIMQAQTGQANVAGCTDNAGNAVTVNPSSAAVYAVTAASGSATYGIQVGTGTIAPSPTDYKLSALIANGSGVGQLNYGACTVGQFTVAAGATTLAITRTWTNGSGASITVTEVGIVCEANSSHASPDYFLILHDLATYQVPNGGNMTAVYTLKGTT